MIDFVREGGLISGVMAGMRIWIGYLTERSGTAYLDDLARGRKDGWKIEGLHVMWIARDAVMQS